MASLKNNEVDVDSDEEEVPDLQAQENAAEAVVEAPVVTDLSNPEVVNKYQEAAKIAQLTLQNVILKCIPGAKIVDICRFGDEFIEQKTSAIFKNKNKAGKVILKGVAFPVCISVNEIICHCSPLESDDSFPPLVANDWVKIDLGVHIDGFITVAAHTLIVPNQAEAVDASAAAPTITPSEPTASVASVPGAAAISAAWVAAEIAVKLVKNGGTNGAVTAAVRKVAEAFDVRPVGGTLMHQMKQFVVDGSKMIQLREDLGSTEQKVEACTFEALEVFALDVAMSTGEGRPRDSGQRTTVYKRAVERKYSLKNKCSRVFFNEVNKRFPTLPFSIRSLPDEKAAKMGVRECVTHQILMPYPVLGERKGDFIGHVKFTVLLLPSGTLAITGLPPPILGPLSAESLSSGPISALSALCGAALVAQAGGEVAAKLGEELMALLNEVRPENKKKAKKAATKKKEGEKESPVEA